MATKPAIQSQLVSIPTLARLRDRSNSAEYESAANGEYPVVRAGTRLKVPLPAVNALLLGMDPFQALADAQQAVREGRGRELIAE